MEDVYDLETIKNIRLSCRPGYASIDPAPLFRTLTLSKSRRNAFKKAQMMEKLGLSKYVEKIIIGTSCYPLEVNYITLDKDKYIGMPTRKGINIKWNFDDPDQEDEEEADGR